MTKDQGYNTGNDNYDIMIAFFDWNVFIVLMWILKYLFYWICYDWTGDREILGSFLSANTDNECFGSLVSILIF